ncbi:MAG TPA: iron-regulated protein, partial [Flavobacterium sp.]|nr:iron-regulated protein [Flavobacterium sp.]
MKKIRSLFIFLFFVTILQAQDKMPYQLFDKKGKKSTYSKLLKAAEKTDVVLFGEHHDNSVV